MLRSIWVQQFYVYCVTKDCCAFFRAPASQVLRGGVAIQLLEIPSTLLLAWMQDAQQDPGHSGNC
jgi:hypothetical protein